MDMSVVYGLTTAVSFFLAAGYLLREKKKNSWLILLYVSVFVVNLGYLALALSGTLDNALMANRIAYLGSVFLPLAMLMVIGDVCEVQFPKKLTGLLLGVSVLVFLIAASPGYLDCYYKEVALVFEHGMARLEKVYGPLHILYYLYLFCYFGMMTALVLYSIRNKRIAARKHAPILLVVVLLNICIWFLEQMVVSPFEFLSVSYIISELLLLFLYGAMQDYYQLLEETKAVLETRPAEPEANQKISDTTTEENMAEVNLMEVMKEHWPEVQQLSARELEVLQCILNNQKRKEISETLCISENTVKTHIRNLYGKLGVENRNDLFQQLVQRQQKNG